jgi:hypothetical protein
VKSLSEAHPDFGCASALVDVHLYVDGRLHVAPGAAEVATPVAGGVTAVVAPPPPPVHGMHWEYHAFETVQHEPEAHVVAPVHPDPPPMMISFGLFRYDVFTYIGPRLRPGQIRVAEPRTRQQQRKS